MFQMFTHIFFPWSLPVFFVAIGRRSWNQAEVQGAYKPQPIHLQQPARARAAKFMISHPDTACSALNN